jgi:hypothetical protein
VELKLAVQNKNVTEEQYLEQVIAVRHSTAQHGTARHGSSRSRRSCAARDLVWRLALLSVPGDALGACDWVIRVSSAGTAARSSRPSLAACTSRKC